MGKIGIAVDARSLLTPHPRGEGRMLRTLYHHIAKLRPEWRIQLYGEQPIDPAIDAAGVSIRALSIPGFRFNLWENFGLPLAAKAAGAKLFHGASSSTPRFPLMPSVMTVHDVIPLV